MKTERPAWERVIMSQPVTWLLHLATLLMVGIIIWGFITTEIFFSKAAIVAGLWLAYYTGLSNGRRRMFEEISEKAKAKKEENQNT